MSNELEVKVRVEDIEHNDRIEFGEWGLEIKQGLTIKDWLDAVLSIQKFDGKIQWYLGDLAVYAESPTTGWGESKYTDLIAATGYAYETLTKYATVARRFPVAFRESILKQMELTPSISFSHFQEVKALDDNFASYWLKKAADNGWGVARLREEVKAWKESRENERTVDMEVDDEGIYVPTFNQAFKDLASWAKNYAKENDADIVRVQIVKDGHVIEEKITEVY